MAQKYRIARVAFGGFGLAAALIAQGCGVRCPETQELDEASGLCRIIDSTSHRNADLGGENLVTWDDGDGGFSPSVVYYPSGDVTEPGMAKIAVAFQSLATDGTTGSAIHLLRIEQTQEGANVVDEIVRESTGTIGAFLSLGYLPVSKRLVIAYFDEVDGKLYTAWENAVGDWTFAHVDGQDYPTGLFVDLAVDAFSDTVHLAYIDSGLHDLRYAMMQDAAVIFGGLNPNGLVDSGAVDLGNGLVNGGLLDKKVSVAVDPLGDPTIAYYDESAGHIRVAHYDSALSQWTRRVVGTRTSTIVQPDSDGRVVIGSNFVQWPDQIEVSKNGLEVTNPVQIISDTQIEIPDYEAAAEYELSYVVPPSNNYGQWNDLAYDEVGTLYLSYFDFQRQSLSFATTSESLTEDQWQIQVVDSSGTVGDKCALAIRTLVTEAQVGYQPVVAYYDGSTADVRATYRRRGNWTAGDVDSRGWTGHDIGLAAGTDGFVAVAYNVYNFETQTYSLRVYRFLPDTLE